MRILGLDYGSKRIGVALCDELGLTAQGLPTLVRQSRRRDMEAIGNLVHRYGVERIVLGLPLRLDGSEGIQCEKVRRFAEVLARAIDRPVTLWDETLTTKEAEAVLREARVPRNRKKALTDRIAASLLLQSYLDATVPGSGRRENPGAQEAPHG